MDARSAMYTCIAFLTTLHLSACYSTVQRPRVTEPVPDSVVVPDVDPPVTLHHPRLEGDTIVGWILTPPGDSTEIALPLMHETREIARSTWIALAVGVALFAALYAAYSGARWDWGGAWGGG